MSGIRQIDSRGLESSEVSDLPRAVQISSSSQSLTLHPGQTHTGFPAWNLWNRRLAEIDRRVEAVEVEELGVGEELEIAIVEADITLRSEILGRGNSVEVGDVLRHIGCPARVERSHVR